MQITLGKQFLVTVRKTSRNGVRSAGVVTTKALAICIMQAGLVIIMATNEVCDGCVCVCVCTRSGHKLTDVG